MYYYYYYLHLMYALVDYSHNRIDEFFVDSTCTEMPPLAVLDLEARIICIGHHKCSFVFLHLSLIRAKTAEEVQLCWWRQVYSARAGKAKTESVVEADVPPPTETQTQETKTAGIIIVLLFCVVFQTPDMFLCWLLIRTIFNLNLSPIDHISSQDI